jgi:hypothetical protein
MPPRNAPPVDAHETVARTGIPLSIRAATAGLAARSVRVDAADVVFVKGIVEASEGVAAVFAERGGDLTVAAPLDRAAALDELLADLAVEIGARVADASFAEER